jgi:hypothetical protein
VQAFGGFERGYMGRYISDTHLPHDSVLRLRLAGGYGELAASTGRILKS